MQIHPGPAYMDQPGGSFVFILDILCVSDAFLQFDLTFKQHRNVDLSLLLGSNQDCPNALF